MNTAAQPTLEPLDPLGQRFLSYFHHGWGFIYAPSPKSGSRPLWQTETRYPLQPRNLWQQYLNPGVLLGLRFGQQTSYLLLDIDRQSKLHPANSLLKYQELLGVLEEIGLCRPIPIQSSDRGGLHIYYFLEEKQHSYTLACAIKQTLEAASFKIKGGELEIFPNCKAYSKGSPSNFNAHRLPLQTGSYLLDDCLQPCSDDIEDLMSAADWSAAGQDYEALSVALAEALSKKVIKFPYRQRNAAEQWEHDLKERISEGWTGPGQTNELLKDIACYGIVFRQLSGQTLVDYIIITACQSPGYVSWCRHQHQIEPRAREWARCCEGFYSPYPNSPQRLNSYKEQFGTRDENKIIDLHPNYQRQQETLERISSVVAQLKQTQKFPARTSDRAAAIIAASKQQYGKGVSQTTLHKPLYLPLWHPDHQQEQSKKQPVNANPESNTAILPPEKFSQIPDPWLEESEAQTQAAQEKQEQSAAIYTPPQYMKVMYSTSAVALLVATPKAEVVNQIQLSSNSRDSSSSDNCSNSSSFSTSSSFSNSSTSSTSSEFSNSDNSIESDNCVDSEKFLNLTTDKQNQCLFFPDQPKNDNKQDLSILSTPDKSDLTNVMHNGDSAVDSSEAIALPDECAHQDGLSVPASTPGQNQPDVETDLPSIPGTQMDEVTQVQTFTPDEHHQSIRLLLHAIASARHWVKVYCITENLSLLPHERIKLEQIVQRLLMLSSPSLILQQDAQQWFNANLSLVSSHLYPIATLVSKSAQINQTM